MTLAHTGKPIVLALCVALVAPGPPATAGHEQNPRRGLGEVGFHPLLNTGFNTDVWAHRTRGNRMFAFSGTFGTTDDCPSQTDNPVDPQASGVKVVNVTRPNRPRLAAVIPDPPGARSNAMRAVRLRTEAFTGDVLASTLEPCGATDAIQQGIGTFPAEQTGFQLHDITNPAEPQKLADYNNGGIGTHNLHPFMRRDLGRAFVAAVQNDVLAALDVLGRLQIVEITDPSAPTLVASWELGDESLDCPLRGNISYCFLHDVWISKDGRTAYLSYWDAGLVLLDISNPEQPRFIGQALTQVDGDGTGWLDEEGNTHSAYPVSIGRRDYVIVMDEDYEGGIRYAAVDGLSPPAVRREYFAQEWFNTPPLDRTGVTGELFYAAGGCTQADYAGAPEGFIALVEIFDCDPLPATLFQHKLSVAETAGASGLVMIWDEPLPGPASADGLIPAVNVGSHFGAKLRRGADPASSTGVRVNLNSRGPMNPWGFLRVVDVTSSNPRRWRQVATFKAPHVAGAATGPEDILTAHNAIVIGRTVYTSWYTNGIRVLRLSSNATPREVAWFVPRPGNHPNDLDQDPHGIQEDNVGFWGVYVARHPRTNQLLTFASDINRGLYVLG